MGGAFHRTFHSLYPSIDHSLTSFSRALQTDFESVEALSVAPDYSGALVANFGTEGRVLKQSRLFVWATCTLHRHPMSTLKHESLILKPETVEGKQHPRITRLIASLCTGRLATTQAGEGWAYVGFVAAQPAPMVTIESSGTF